MKLAKFEIMPFGFRVSFVTKTKDYNKKVLKANLLELKKIIVAASGPFINLLAILTILLQPNHLNKETLIYSNLIIIVFNLMPIYPLDGGRILQGFLHIFLGGKISKKLTNVSSNVLMIIITVIGSIAIFYFENISIFLIIMFLWFIVFHENKKYKVLIKAYNAIEGGATSE